MKRRAMKIWADNANRTRESIHNEHQNAVIAEIQEMKNKMCQFEQSSLYQDNDVDATNKDERKKAYRTIGNYFMRNYTDGTRYVMKIWRQQVKVHRHKQQVLMNTVAHYKKNQLEFCARFFKKFVHDEREKEAKESISRTILE